MRYQRAAEYICVLHQPWKIIPICGAGVLMVDIDDGSTCGVIVVMRPIILT